MRRRIPEPGTPLSSLILPHVPPRQPEWIWPEWIARGMVHVIEGEEGAGMSTIINSLVSISSNPRARWPGDIEGKGQTGIRTLLYSEESPYPQTPAHDLHANRANLENILLGTADSWWHLLENVDELCDNPGISKIDLVVVDNWAWYVSRTSDIHENKNLRIRRALTELAEICEDHNIAALVAMHTRKNYRAGSVRERIRWGADHRAVPRIVMSVELDRGDPDHPRVLARTKETLRISLERGFRITMKRDQSLTYQPVEGYGPDLIQEAMKSTAPVERGPTKADRIEAYIDEHGPTPYRQLIEELDMNSKALSNVLRNLPGWTRVVTFDEAVEHKLDLRARMVERPS